MPTPLGHSLAAIAVQFAGRNRKPGRAWPSLLLLVALANLADIDFLAGYLVCRLLLENKNATHSLLAAVLVGSITCAFIGAVTGRYAAGIALATAAYGSHILLDMLLGQTRTPSVGLQIFWPFSKQAYLLPWSVFKMAPISILTNPVAT